IHTPSIAYGRVIRSRRTRTFIEQKPPLAHKRERDQCPLSLRTTKMTSYVVLGLELSTASMRGAPSGTPPSPTSRRTISPPPPLVGAGRPRRHVTSYLANIASWADTFRSTTAGACCSVNYARDCGATGCVVSAIANYTQRRADAAEALRFLVHFVGDITQPLHDEAFEAGANGVAVTFMGFSDNLHSDWDTFMPEELIGGSSLADAQSTKASWIAGDDVGNVITTATRWATDANALVCSVVMPNGAAALTAETDLFPTYYDDVIGTIELQIAKGGYRLANWLNTIFETEVAAKREIVEGAEKRGGLLASRTEHKRELVDESELDGRKFLPEPRR
ncbi:phospholipase C/P1 nuclease domain-containing protein, partial [Mycena rosella]